MRLATMYVSSPALAVVLKTYLSHKSFFTLAILPSLPEWLYWFSDFRFSGWFFHYVWLLIRFWLHDKLLRIISYYGTAHILSSVLGSTDLIAPENINFVAAQYKVGHKNRPLRLYCLYCTCTCLVVQAIQYFNRRFFLHKTEPKLDKCVKILNRNITI